MGTSLAVQLLCRECKWEEKIGKALTHARHMLKFSNSGTSQAGRQTYLPFWEPLLSELHLYLEAFLFPCHSQIRLRANETRSKWTRSIFSVPMRRVPTGRVPMRRVPNRRGYLFMADTFTWFIKYGCIIDVFMRNERCAF